PWTTSRGPPRARSRSSSSGTLSGVLAPDPPVIGGGSGARSDLGEPEDRVIGGIGGLVEELFHLAVPLVPVGGDDRRAQVDRQLLGGEPEQHVVAAADLALPRRPQVPHPVGLPPGSHQVGATLVLQPVAGGRVLL